MVQQATKLHSCFYRSRM